MFQDRIQSSINWSIIHLGLKSLIQTIATIFLVRILYPQDFGLISLVNTFAGFLFFFADLGLSWVIIQEKSLSSEKINNIFWMNLSFGVFLAIFCFLSSSLIADFYNEPLIKPIIKLHAFNFIFIGINSNLVALLKRDIKFKSIAINNLIAVICGYTVCFIMIFYGFRYWSLAFISVVTNFIYTVLLFKKVKIKISWPKWKKEDFHLVKFGGILSISGIFFYISRNFDDILVGKNFEPSTLGFYTKAYFLMFLFTKIPSSAIGDVIVPVIANNIRDNKNDWIAIYRKKIGALIFFTAPFCLILSLWSNEIILIVYGEKWLSVIPLIFWLGLAGIFQPLYNSIGWLLLGGGKIRYYFIWSVYIAVVLSIGFLLAISEGLVAMTRNYMIISILLILIPWQLIAHKKLKISFLKTCKELFPVFLCLFFMFLSIITLDWLEIFFNIHFIITFFIKFFISFFIYYICSKIFIYPHPFEEFILKKQGT